MTKEQPFYSKRRWRSCLWRKRQNVNYKNQSKRVAGTVVIATADMPLEGGTAQLRIYDAESAIKWDTSLSYQECASEKQSTKFSKLRTPACFNTSVAEPVANPQNGRSDPGWHVKLKIQDRDMVHWHRSTSVCDAWVLLQVVIWGAFKIWQRTCRSRGCTSSDLWMCSHETVIKERV